MIHEILDLGKANSSINAGAYHISSNAFPNSPSPKQTPHFSVEYKSEGLGDINNNTYNLDANNGIAYSEERSLSNGNDDNARENEKLFQDIGFIKNINSNLDANEGVSNGENDANNFGEAIDGNSLSGKVLVDNKQNITSPAGEGIKEENNKEEKDATVNVASKAMHIFANYDNYNDNSYLNVSVYGNNAGVAPVASMVMRWPLKPGLRGRPGSNPGWGASAPSTDSKTGLDAKERVDNGDGSRLSEDDEGNSGKLSWVLDINSNKVIASPDGEANVNEKKNKDSNHNSLSGDNLVISNDKNFNVNGSVDGEAIDVYSSNGKENNFGKEANDLGDNNNKVIARGEGILIVWH